MAGSRLDARCDELCIEFLSALLTLLSLASRTKEEISAIHRLPVNS